MTAVPKVSCSRLGAMLGLDKRKSPLMLWMEMRGEVVEEDQGDEAPVEEGREFEDAIAKIAARRYGLKLVPGPAELEDDDLIGHPDRYVVDQEGKVAVLEVKHLFTEHVDQDQWGPSMTDEVPRNFWLQATSYQRLATQWEQGNGYPIAGSGCADYAYLAARLHGGVRLYKLPRKQEVEDVVMARVREFRRAVELGQAPNIEDERDARLRWLVQPNTHRDIGPEDLSLVLELDSLRKTRKQIEERESAVAMMLLALAQEKARLRYAGVDVLSLASDRRFDAAAFARDLPNVASDPRYLKLDTSAIRRDLKAIYESYMRMPEKVEDQKRVLRVLKGAEQFQPQGVTE